jgi:hypothetical protein
MGAKAIPWGNIYAPQWMGISPGLAGYDDRESDISLPLPTAGSPTNGVLVPAASITAPQPLKLDSDADYLVRDIEFALIPPDTDDAGLFGNYVGPLDIRVRIRDGNGRLFTSDFVPVVDLMGPLCPVWPLERGAVIYVEYQNTNPTIDALMVMVLKAWKRVSCPGRPAPVASDYTPMYRRYAQHVTGKELEDFEYPFEFTSSVGVATDLLRIPIQTDNDADFLWRGLVGDWITSNNDNEPVGLAWVVFWDPHNTPLSVYPQIVPWGSQNAGQPRENVFSNSGGRMAPHFPEIFIPRGGVVELTISFGANTPASILRGSLRGVKLYDAKGTAAK